MPYGSWVQGFASACQIVQTGTPGLSCLLGPPYSSIDPNYHLQRYHIQVLEGK